MRLARSTKEEVMKFRQGDYVRIELPESYGAGCVTAIRNGLVSVYIGRGCGQGTMQTGKASSVFFQVNYEC